MAGNRAERVGGGEKTEFNMTPMIDVTFQLIIFFLIAGQAAEDEIDPRIQLQEPVESQAIDDPAVLRVGNRVIVNVVAKNPGPNDPAGDRHMVEYYFVRMPLEPGETPDADWGRVKPESGNAVGTLKAFLERKYVLASEGGLTANNRDFVMILRADRTVKWNQIQPVLDAAVQAQIPNMNLAALTRTGEGEGTQ